MTLLRKRQNSKRARGRQFKSAWAHYTQKMSKLAEEPKKGTIKIEYREYPCSEGKDYIINFMQDKKKIFSESYHFSHDEPPSEKPLDLAIKRFKNEVEKSGLTFKKVRGYEIEIDKK